MIVNVSWIACYLTELLLNYQLIISVEHQIKVDHFHSFQLLMVVE